jgi:hypothetical protein
MYFSGDSAGNYFFQVATMFLVPYAERKTNIYYEVWFIEFVFEVKN